MATEHKPIVLINGEFEQLPNDGYIARLEEEVPQRQEIDFQGEDVVNPTDLTFSSVGNTITTAGGVDWTSIGFADNDTIIITETELNDGAYTIIGDPTSTIITVSESLVNEGTGDASATIRSNPVIYKGWAELNSLTSDPIWKCQQIRFVGADEDVVYKWVDSANYSQIWDNHLDLTYT